MILIVLQAKLESVGEQQCKALLDTMRAAQFDVAVDPSSWPATVTQPLEVLGLPVSVLWVQLRAAHGAGAAAAPRAGGPSAAAASLTFVYCRTRMDGSRLSMCLGIGISSKSR